MRRMKRVWPLVLLLLAGIVGLSLHFHRSYPVQRFEPWVKLVQQRHPPVSEASIDPQLTKALSWIQSWGTQPKDARDFLLSTLGPIDPLQGHLPESPDLWAKDVYAQLQASSARMAAWVEKSADLQQVLLAVQLIGGDSCVPADDAKLTRCQALASHADEIVSLGLIHLIHADLTADSRNFLAISTSLHRIDEARLLRSANLLDSMISGRIRRVLVLSVGVIARASESIIHRNLARTVLGALKLDRPKSMQEVLEAELTWSSVMVAAAIEQAYRPFAPPVLAARFLVSGQGPPRIGIKVAEKVAALTGFLRYTLVLGDIDRLMHEQLLALVADLRDYEVNPTERFVPLRYQAKVQEIKNRQWAGHFLARNYLGEVMLLVAVPDYSALVTKFWESQRRNLAFRAWLLGLPAT